MIERASQRPRITVATVVARAGALLFVEEESPDGLVLNQPAGHLEAGESLIQAAARETLEESAWTVSLTHIVGIYQWRTDAGVEYVRVGFAAEPISHDPQRTLDTGIQRALWLTPAQMRADRSRLRSPMVEALVNDWLAGVRYPLELLCTFQP